jgi:hypothetical protein
MGRKYGVGEGKPYIHRFVECRLESFMDKHEGV